jgi:hypothetical protein
VDRARIEQERQEDPRQGEKEGGGGGDDDVMAVERIQSI